MNGYVTDQRFARTIHLPISFSQTILKAGKTMFLASYEVAIGQRLEIRSLTLNLLQVVTSGVVPILGFSAYKTCNVGLYRGASDCSPLAFVSVEANGANGINCFRNTAIETPGEYRVIIKNNSTNVDLSVTALGTVKLFY